MASRLTPELKRLVSRVGAALGQVIERSEGRPLYRKVEAVRRQMVRFRDAHGPAKRRALRSAARILSALSPRDQDAVARAYTLYLELVNACENAYRTHRLRERFAEHPPSPGRSRLTFVLTAHPTESRSPDNIRLLRRIQNELPNVERVIPWLSLLWAVPTHPPHKPRPEDEAAHLFSLLGDPTLDELLTLRAEGHDVRLRTWVGGDRDGHPGVGPRQLWASLRLSRARLSGYLRTLLREALADAQALGGPAARHAAEVRRALAALRTVLPGDGARVRRFSQAVGRAGATYHRRAGAAHPGFVRAAALLEVFPGLVVPLELRDEARAFGPGSPIESLLRTVRDAARGAGPRDYAQGCVISRVETSSDVLGALRAVQRVFGRPALPVIPLFESPTALAGIESVLDGCWRDAAFRRSLSARQGKLEVMLGYSDSAKRMGAFPSRVAVRRAMLRLSRWCAARRLSPIFFHGAGGSEGRGGGTIEEQASVWPPESLDLVKLTLQGEMVERTLATPEIFRSNVLHWAAVQRRPPAVRREHPLAARLSELAEVRYARLAGDRALPELLRRATPYGRLAALRIGSRPFARRSEAGLEAVRAIPWVLCWTQTRLLLPAWFGLGAAWTALRKEGARAAELRRAAASDPLLRGYVRMLAFSLAKCEPLVWEAYVRSLAPASVRPLAEDIGRELEGCRRFLEDAGRTSWDRPWLRESIFYRAPMIHPLNLLQIETLAGRTRGAAGERLFRETVTGIAAGMLTTG